MTTPNGKATLTALATACSLLLCHPANAFQVKDGGISADEVAQVLKDKGYKADVQKDQTGDPMIKSGSGGINYTILFYGCHHTTRCASLQFYAGFHLEKGMSFERINEWNKANRFGRGYVDKDGDPNVEMDLDVEHGFLTEGLANNLETWDLVASSFKKWVDS